MSIILVVNFHTSDDDDPYISFEMPIVAPLPGAERVRGVLRGGRDGARRNLRQHSNDRLNG